jgi:hypothetical protein
VSRKNPFGQMGIKNTHGSFNIYEFTGSGSITF